MMKASVALLAALLVCASHAHVTLTANASCDVSGSTVSQLQPVILTINQQFKGQTQKFTWVIDLCQPTQRGPTPDGPRCSETYRFLGPAYIQQYMPKQSYCVDAYDMLTGYGLHNGLWTANFTVLAGGGNATVIGQCAEHIDLRSVGDVVVTVTNTSAHTRFTFAAKAFCLSGAPTSKRVPPK